MRASLPSNSGILEDSAVDLLLVDLISLAFIFFGRCWNRNKHPVEDNLHNSVIWNGIAEDGHQLRVLSADDADEALLDDTSMLYALTKPSKLQIGRALSTMTIAGTAALWAIAAYFVREIIDSWFT